MPCNAERWRENDPQSLGLQEIPVFMGIFRGTQERAAVAYLTERNPTAFIWQPAHEIAKNKIK